jgi:hypothetical protein
LILTAGQLGRINLSQNFVQRQCHLNLIAVAPRREKLGRGPAKFSKGDSYGSKSELGENFLQRQGNGRGADIGLHDPAFELEREAAEHGLK